jgi:hypothetical protein
MYDMKWESTAQVVERYVANHCLKGLFAGTGECSKGACWPSRTGTAASRTESLFRLDSGTRILRSALTMTPLGQKRTNTHKNAPPPLTLIVLTYVYTWPHALPLRSTSQASSKRRRFRKNQAQASFLCRGRTLTPVSVSAESSVERNSAPKIAA